MLKNFFWVLAAKVVVVGKWPDWFIWSCEAFAVIAIAVIILALLRSRRNKGYLNSCSKGTLTGDE